MRHLGSMIALLALTASAPALASDSSTESAIAQRSVGRVQAAQEARVTAPEARKEARPCDCSCARSASGERQATSNGEPARH